MLRKFFSLALIVSTVFFFTPNISLAAGIGFDNQSTGGGMGTSLTFSHTINSNSNGLLLCSFQDESGDTISGATYNGVSMTQLSKVAHPIGDEIYVFGLRSPTSGTNNVTVNRGGSGTSLQARCASYVGVNQISLTCGAGNTCDAVNTHTAAIASSDSITVTTNTNNDWVFVAALQRVLGGNITASGGGSGLTLRNSTDNFVILDSNAAFTPAGVFTGNLSSTAAGSWAEIAVAFSPAAAPSFNFWQMWDF